MCVRLQAVRQAGVRDGVLLLDEIDKVSRDARGDPAAALLEILDPEQNHAFVDNYLALGFDLSKVSAVYLLHLVPGKSVAQGARSTLAWRGCVNPLSCVPPDLQVIFLATANSLASVPAPLLDRLEVVHLSGYTLDEKVR